MESIHLSHSQVTDAGIIELEPFKNLTAVHLDKTKITDVGLQRLSGFKKLYWILLSADNTQVTDAGERQLRMALPECTIRRTKD